MSAAGAKKEWIVIRGVGSVSGLGYERQEILQAYASGQPCFKVLQELDSVAPVAPISASAEASLQQLLQDSPHYTSLDRSVQLAILAARQAVAEAGWTLDNDEPTGVNIGSSRGATGLFEQAHAQFLKSPSQRLPPATSPSTTLGNLASWVAQDLQTSGPVISHSVTCSTALQAFANGVAWLKSGMAKRFLVGGTEAPLTPFTLAQMKALGIYTKFPADQQPCRPLNTEGLNTFALGEGAAIFALERMNEAEIRALGQEHVVLVEAVGMGLEKITSKTGITANGEHFQRALKEVLKQAALSPDQIDSLVLHAPGTKAGDAAEMAAVSEVFAGRMPPCFTNKDFIGHTLGASGGLSVAMAVELLTTSPSPFLPIKFQSITEPIERIMVNAAGFGGNAASVLLKKLSF